MKKTIVLTNIVLLSSLIISCATTLYLQPHVSPISTSKPFDSDAGIIISPMDLEREYTKSSIFGGDIRVPLGTPFRDLARETFTPFLIEYFSLVTKIFQLIPLLLRFHL